jgi:hypothetical protein
MAHEIRADYASGSMLYAIIRSPSGQVWHPAGQAFEDWGTAGHTVGDYHIPLADRSGSRYVGSFDANIPGGYYCVQVFLQAGAGPADTDALVGSREVLWTGAGEMTSARLLVNKAVQNNATKTVEYYDDDGQTILLTQTLTDDGVTTTRALQ